MKEIRSRITSIIAMLLIVPLVSFAYADDNNTKSIPFDSTKYNPLSEYCNEGSNGSWICIWDPNSIEETVEEVDNVSDLETESELVCFDRYTLVDGECVPVYDNFETDVVPADIDRIVVHELQEEIDVALKPFRDDLNRCEADPPRTLSEREYCMKLEYLATCQRGTQESEGVQEKSRFAVSSLWTEDDEVWAKSLEFRGNHQKLERAIEECKAQHTTLEPVILGLEYLNRAKADRPQVHHDSTDIVLDIRPHHYEELDKQSFEKSQDNAQSVICGHGLYSQNTKEIYNCPSEYGYHNTGSVIEYNSPAYTKYNLYKTSQHVPIYSSGYTHLTTDQFIDKFSDRHGNEDRTAEAIEWLKQYYGSQDYTYE